MPAERLPELETLVGLFYEEPARLGRFAEVRAEALPEAPQRLLAHDHHMTVTVESFHDSPVTVEVLDARSTGNSYWRKILLRRADNGQVVQFGIVRLDFQYVSAEVRAEIEQQGTPLGRVLINHNVMRKVELHSLWQIEPGVELRELFSAVSGGFARVRPHSAYLLQWRARRRVAGNRADARQPALTPLPILPCLSSVVGCGQI